MTFSLTIKADSESSAICFSLKGDAKAACSDTFEIMPTWKNWQRFTVVQYYSHSRQPGFRIYHDSDLRLDTLENSHYQSVYANYRPADFLFAPSSSITFLEGYHG